MLFTFNALQNSFESSINYILTSVSTKSFFEHAPQDLFFQCNGDGRNTTEFDAIGLGFSYSIKQSL